MDTDQSSLRLVGKKKNLKGCVFNVGLILIVVFLFSFFGIHFSALCLYYTFLSSFFLFLF